MPNMASLRLNDAPLTISVLMRIAKAIETGGGVVVTGGRPNLEMPVTGWLDAVINDLKARKRAKS